MRTHSSRRRLLPSFRLVVGKVGDHNSPPRRQARSAWWPRRPPPRSVAQPSLLGWETFVLADGNVISLPTGNASEGSGTGVDLKPSAEQHQLIEAFAGLYADLCPPEVVAAAEPLGHDATLWQRLLETDIVGMALPESAGGSGATCSTSLSSPSSTARASLPPRDRGAGRRARLWRGWLAASRLVAADLGGRLVTIAVRPASDGRAELVPAGAIADAAIVLVDDSLVLVPLADRATHVTNLGCLPLADVADLSGDVLASGPQAVEQFATAVDEWRVLTAARWPEWRRSRSRSVSPTSRNAGLRGPDRQLPRCRAPARRPRRPRSTAPSC